VSVLVGREFSNRGSGACCSSGLCVLLVVCGPCCVV